jgi:hemoglobin
MDEPVLPNGLVEARRTPLFTASSLPAPLVETHATTVWGELRVQTGSLQYSDLAGDDPRNLRLDAGDAAVIAPGVPHRVEPATDATFYIQFFREPDAPLVPGDVETSMPHRSRQWEPRGCDLDSVEEIFELVTRQYTDVTQDDVLAPYFDVDGSFVDWQAHIGAVTDYWSHVLLYAPGYDVDAIEHHRPIHADVPFTPESFDRWLRIFHVLDEKIEPFYDEVVRRNPGEVEFHQAVREVLDSLGRCWPSTPSSPSTRSSSASASPSARSSSGCPGSTTAARSRSTGASASSSTAPWAPTRAGCASTRRSTSAS